MINIKNPSCLKDSLLVALEVLPKTENNELKDFANNLPYTVERLSLYEPNEVKKKLYDLIIAFKSTKTFHWLREDFKNALNDIEIQTIY